MAFLARDLTNRIKTVYLCVLLPTNLLRLYQKMPQNSPIIRFCSLCLTALMLFISVWSKAQVPTKHVEKAKTGQESSKDKSPKAVYLSELSPMTSTAPVAIDFQQSFFLLPPVYAPAFAVKSSLVAYKKPYFTLSYFEKIFEKHIAIGAP